MARAGAGKNWTLRAPSNKANKGAGASKRAIGRCFHHGVPDVEERSIERTVRQEGKKEIARALEDVDPRVPDLVGKSMSPFRSIFAKVVFAAFETHCGKRQVHVHAEPKAFQIQFALSINHEIEDGYRTLEIALYAPNNYVQVWVRQTWNIIPIDDLEYADGECIGTKPGKKYRGGSSGWRKVADHDRPFGSGSPLARGNPREDPRNPG